MDAFGFFAFFTGGYFIHGQISPILSGSEDWFVELLFTEFDYPLIRDLLLAILNFI